MKKEEVSAKLKAVKAKIAKIEEKKKDEVVLYATKDKYLDGVGYVSEIDTFDGLVKAQTKINKLTSTDITEAVEMLGLTDNEVPNDTTRILGFLPKHWNADIKTRVSELRTEILLEKLYNAEEKLLKHADTFELDTEGIDDLLDE